MFDRRTIHNIVLGGSLSIFSLSFSPSSSLPFSLHSFPCDAVSEKTLDAESIERSNDIGGQMVSSGVVVVQFCTLMEDINIKRKR